MKKGHSKSRRKASHKNRDSMSKCEKEFLDEKKATSSCIEDSNGETYPMLPEENSEIDRDESEEVEVTMDDLFQELVAAIEEVGVQKKKCKRAMLAKKEMECIVEETLEKKALLEERIVAMEQELALVKEDAIKYQSCASDVLMIQKEKDKLKLENASLLENVEELSQKMESQKELNHDKVALKEKVMQLEEKVTIMQDEVSSLNKEKEELQVENRSLMKKIDSVHQKFVMEVTKLHIDKNLMEHANGSLLKDVDEFTSKLKNEMKKYEDLVAKMDEETTPCGAESSSKHVAWKESSMKLKECLESQRPYAMDKQGLGYIEDKSTNSCAENLFDHFKIDTIIIFDLF